MPAPTLADLDAHPAITAARARWGRGELPSTYRRTAVLEAGVREADLDLFGARTTEPPNIGPETDDGAASRMCLHMLWVGQDHPDLTVTAAVRWIVVAEWLDEEPAPDLIEFWSRMGFAEDGWRYAAAGLTPAEAAALRTRHALPDSATLDGMAALRGFVPLPD